MNEIALAEIEKRILSVLPRIIKTKDLVLGPPVFQKHPNYPPVVFYPGHDIHVTVSTLRLGKAAGIWYGTSFGRIYPHDVPDLEAATMLFEEWKSKVPEFIYKPSDAAIEEWNETSVQDACALYEEVKRLSALLKQTN